MENRSSILFASCTLAFVIVAVTTFSTQLSQAAIDCKPRCSEVEQQQHKEMDNQLNKARTELNRGNSTAAFMHLDSITNLINRHACLPSCALHAGAQQHLNNSRISIQQGDNTARLASLEQAQNELQKHFEARAVMPVILPHRKITVFQILFIVTYTLLFYLLPILVQANV
jgi:hypothetical protein